MSKTTISIPPQLLMPQPEPGPQKAPPDLPPVSHHVKAAIAVGAFVTIALFAIYLTAAYLLPALRPAWLPVLLVAFTIGVVFTAWCGVMWTRTAATRPWTVDDLERYRRWKLEDEARKAAQENAPEIEPPLSLPERIALAGYQVLAWHYVEGLAASRAECEAKGLGQKDWNKIQYLLKEIKVKSEAKWLIDDYTEAARRWSRVQVWPDGRAWIGESDSSGTVGRMVELPK